MSFREAISTFRGHRAPHFSIIPRKKWWFALSGSFILLALIGLTVRGLNYSIDFRGGALLQYPDRTGVSADDVVKILSNFGRSDAEIQVVAGSNGAQVNVRTRSLADLGGPPKTQYTYPNPKGLTADDLRLKLAAFGLSKSRIQIRASGIRLVTPPAGEVAAGPDIVLIYHSKTSGLTADAVKTELAKLGRAGPIVTVVGDDVVVQFQPPPLPTPSPSPSASASASPSAGSSPSASPSVSPSTSSIASGASAAKAKVPAATATKKANASPSPEASSSPKASPTPTPSVTPSASPSVTTSPTAAHAPTVQDIVAALATQAGITPKDITPRPLKTVTQKQVVGALAGQEGIPATQIQIKQLGGDARARLLKDLATQAGIQAGEINITDVGPTWGSQISKKALQGLVIFLILVTVYIAFRFEWKMAMAAQTALAHDLIITAGIYALVGREVTPATVIAILTILGYSLYDTVVIFDRVKENTESLALVARDTYSGVVNLSLNETLMRSVNTSLVVLLPILSLLLFGGATLKDFAFALFIGVASGTYSSIFIASPMLALLKEREPRYQQIRARALSRAARGGPAARRTTLRSVQPAAGALPADGAEAGDGEAARPAATAARRPSSGAQRAGGQRSKVKGKGKKKSPAAKRRRR